ncbi:odorant receptor 131-2-like [Cyprinodon tularosa]|uniref:odorant receptor 131-2-like n=1 Tax=Cyprinodon tularosa TaxID=77115 RepID=UPI0018E218A6|nr:odorant receptor 131-2-like [Cyprinodon tularosa]
MTIINQTQLNTTLDMQRHGILALVLFSTMTTLPCCVFLFINLTMLYTLRSKAVFVETSRYILLFNLLFADTTQLAQSQSMFLLSTARVTMSYSVCVGLTLLNFFTFSVSIITLVIMCLERYIAVCYPLRHSAIITTRNTGWVICVIWCVSLFDVITQLGLILRFSFPDLQLTQMIDFCGKESIFLDPASDLYYRTFTYFLFVLGGVTVFVTYTGIVVAAHSASTDEASASKARRTLLLHLLQMGLTVSSTMFNSLTIVISKHLERLEAIRIQVFLYICIMVLPKCLSSLIYGLRDQTIRPILMLNLCCQWRGSVSMAIVLRRKNIRVYFT